MATKAVQRSAVQDWRSLSTAQRRTLRWALGNTTAEGRVWGTTARTEAVLYLGGWIEVGPFEANEERRTEMQEDITKWVAQAEVDMHEGRWQAAHAMLSMALRTTQELERKAFWLTAKAVEMVRAHQGGRQ